MKGDSSARRIEVVASRDELNLAEYPFCLLTNRPYGERSSIRVEREVRDPATGGITKQEWTATGNEKGLPTARDMDVYVALMELGKRYGIDSDRKIHFSRYELVRLQRRTPGMLTYEQLEESLERLAGVKIYTRDAFFDARTKRRTSTAFGIIDNYKIVDARLKLREGREGEQLELHFHRSWVQLNSVLYDQVERGGLKELDTETYYRLRYHVSRRLFRFLDRMREKGAARYEVDLSELAHLMPLHDTRPSRQLRDLGKAHEELVLVGYLEKVEEARTRAGVRLVYAFPAVKLDRKAEALVRRGISTDVARRLAQDLPERIDAQVETFDRLVAESSPRIGRNPAGYLRRAIEEGWAAPPARPAARPTARSSAALAPRLREEKALRQLYQSLDEATRREIDERAIARAREEVGPTSSERALALAAARWRDEILRESSQQGPRDPVPGAGGKEPQANSPRATPIAALRDR